jgi:WD40 repeat protein
LISDDVGRLAVVACALIDGDPIAVVGSFDEAPQAWNLRTGDLHAVADRQAVEAVSCSLVDGLPVAVLSGPFDVRLWDLATGQVHRLATLPGETANSVTCSPVDGTSVATTAHSDGVRIWDLNARELVDWIPLPNPVNATLTNGGDLAVVFQRGISVFGYRH